MDRLIMAIQLAADAFAGEVDRAGTPLIFHSLRVMMSSDLETEDERVLAVLHDVIEDGKHHLFTNEMSILNKFGKETYDAIRALSRNAEENYFDYIGRVMENQRAVKVKLADIHDNLSRLSSLPPDEAKSLKSRYEKALKILTGEPSDTVEGESGRKPPKKTISKQHLVSPPDSPAS